MLRFLIAFVVVIALLLHNLPLLVRDQVVIWLLDNGAETAQLKTLRVEWFSGRITVERLSAVAEGKPKLQADKLLVDLDYSKLSEKKALLSLIELQGLNAGIREHGDSLWLGPIDLNALSNDTGTEEQMGDDAPSEWSFGLAELVLGDINWRAELAGQDHSLQVKQGRLSDFYLWDQQQPVSIDLDGALNGAPVELSSSSKPLPQEKSSELKIKLDNFPIHSVTALFLPELRAMVDLDLNIKAKSDLASKVTSVTQSGAIRIRDFAFQQTDLAIQSKSLSWNGSVDLALNGSELTNLKSKNKINLAQLDLKQLGNSVEAESLALQAAVDLQGLKKLQANGVDLALSNLKLQQDNKLLSLQRAKLQADVKTPDMSQWMVSAPSTQLQHFKLSVAGDSLVELSRLDLNRAEVKHTEQINLGALKLSGLTVMGDGGVFSRWQNIGLQNLNLTQLNQLDIGSIKLSDSQTRVHLSKQRQLSDLDWLLGRLSDGNKQEKSGADSSDPFTVHIGKLDLTGKNKLAIMDGGVAPAFKTELDINKLQLNQINTASDGKTDFLLEAKNKFSLLNAKGAIELFSGNYGGNWDLEIKGLELPQVSPYSLQYTGYYLHSGQLSVTSKGEIKDRKLDGDSDIRLNKLQVEVKNSERSGEFNQKVSMPLDTAIMILQDNDDNIDLQIPIDGSLDDPQFGYQTVINKLAGKGLKSAAMGYLTKALQPFGTLITLSKMVMDAQDKGSFINLQPVYFAPAQSALSAESKQYITKLGQMLNERKAMRMNICGYAVAADQPKVWAALLDENKKRKEPLKEAELKSLQEQKLQQLAQQRSDVIKGELSGKLGIDIERLFSCLPKVDLSSKEKPQVALGL